jgi:hypothetical protein
LRKKRTSARANSISVLRTGCRDPKRVDCRIALLQVWAATGETFNSKGKSDILIRNGNANLFIAECKVWNGKNKFVESIDQLFGT